MMKTLSSLLPLGWLLSAAALVPGQALALAYQNGASTSAVSTTHDPAYGFLDGVGYVLTANVAQGNYSACSGAALSSRLVMTSAHCFDFNYDNKTDNSRTMFYAWGGSGNARGLTQYNGSVVVAPQHHISHVGGYRAYNDVALIVLDTPLSLSTPTYAVYSGDLSDSALAQLEGGAMLAGYGQHHEEGRPVEAGSAYSRWVGYTKVSGFDGTRGGTLQASLVEGTSTLSPGDSGGPMLSWTESADGSPLGVIMGTAAYARDNQGNGSYADLGDESFWSFTGGLTEFIRQVAAQNGETVRFVSSSGARLSACPTGSTCAGFPGSGGSSGPGHVPGVPEPGQFALMGVGLVVVLARTWLGRRAAQG